MMSPGSIERRCLRARRSPGSSASTTSAPTSTSTACCRRGLDAARRDQGGIAVTGSGMAPTAPPIADVAGTTASADAGSMGSGTVPVHNGAVGVARALRGSPHAALAPIKGEDAVLVERLKQGDEAAFLVLVEDNSRSLRRIARLYATDAVAEEVVQDTWIAVIRGLDRFEGRASLRTWIVKILINIARSRG